LLLQGKRQKKREERDENLRRVNAAKRRKMKRRNTKRKQQHNYDVANVIDTIEKAASIAMKIYRAVKPIAKAILTNGRKTK
jgi:hypothetical protein